MESITLDNVHCFLERFYSLYDASINSITVAYPSFGETSASILLRTRDQLAVDGNTIRILVEDIEEIVFKEVNTSLQRLSSGLNFKSFDGLVWLSIQPLTTNLTNANDFRDSYFYIAAHKCAWEVVLPNDSIA